MIYLYFSTFIVTNLLLMSSLVTAQDDSRSRALAALGALQTWYNTNSGIWDTCGWWNGANCMTTLADLARIDNSVVSAATEVFSNTFARAPAVNPAPGIQKLNGNGGVQTSYAADWLSMASDQPFGIAGNTDASLWTDGFYDDDLWWALAWVAAYDVTKDPTYLSLAEGIFELTSKAWPTHCSGGITWNNKKDDIYVNAIANELFLSTAAHLANRVSSRQEHYLNWATRSWTWFRDSGMINEKGLINDGLDANCKNNGYQTWTYNQGVVIGGLVELSRASPLTASKASPYLDAATRIALAAITHMTDKDHVILESCEPNCAPDGTQFKGIFIRNLAMLHEVDPRGEYAQVIRNSANSIWTKDRDDQNRFSVSWSGPFVQSVNASSHSSAMDALVAAARLE